MLQCPMDQEHEESWHMCIYNKLLTAQVKLVLLVVNSIKLHLTAFKLHDTVLKMFGYSRSPYLPACYNSLCDSMEYGFSETAQYLLKPFYHT